MSLVQKLCIWVDRVRPETPSGKRSESGMYEAPKLACKLNVVALEWSTIKVVGFRKSFWGRCWDPGHPRSRFELSGPESQWVGDVQGWRIDLRVGCLWACGV